MAEPSDEWQRVAGRERPYYRCQNSSLRKELREHKSEPHIYIYNITYNVASSVCVCASVTEDIIM